jgi:hypothetical protein
MNVKCNKLGGTYATTITTLSRKLTGNRAVKEGERERVGKWYYIASHLHTTHTHLHLVVNVGKSLWEGWRGGVHDKLTHQLQPHITPPYSTYYQTASRFVCIVSCIYNILASLNVKGGLWRYTNWLIELWGKGVFLWHKDCL